MTIRAGEPSSFIQPEAPDASNSKVVNAERIDGGYLGRVLRLTLLAPDIVEAVRGGRQAEGVAPRMLIGPVPADWDGRRQSARMRPEDVR